MFWSIVNDLYIREIVWSTIFTHLVVVWWHVHSRSQLVYRNQPPRMSCFYVWWNIVCIYFCQLLWGPDYLCTPNSASMFYEALYYHGLHLKTTQHLRLPKTSPTPPHRTTATCDYLVASLSHKAKWGFLSYSPCVFHSHQNNYVIEFVSI